MTSYFSGQGNTPGGGPQGNRPPQNQMNQNNPMGGGNFSYINQLLGMKKRESNDNIFGEAMGGGSGQNSFSLEKPQPVSSLNGMFGRDSNVSKGSNNSIGIFDNKMSEPSTQPSSMNSNANNQFNNQAKNMMEKTINEQEKMIQSRKDDIANMNNQFNSNSQLLRSLKEKSDRLRQELDRLNNEYKAISNKVSIQNEEIKQEINQIGNMTNSIIKAANNMSGSKHNSSFGSMQNTPNK